MPKENKNAAELVQLVEQARAALDGALTILWKRSGTPTSNPRSAPASKDMHRRNSSLDFTMPVRAFVKKYAGGMNGAQKFTLLLAHAVKGDMSKTVALADIEAQWNKMAGKGLLGMKFNRFHTSLARENDWASTEKAGSYRLRPSWKDILDG